MLSSTPQMCNAVLVKCFPCQNVSLQLLMQPAVFIFLLMRVMNK